MVTTETVWKVGDWTFCEFKLQQIEEVEDGRVTVVSDGHFSLSSRDLADRCMPVSLSMKRISDEYASVSHRLHRVGSSGLNYPDINRWLIAAWVDACREPENRAAIDAHYKLLGQFMRDMLDKTDIESGYGFPLLTRRGR